jgi:NAD(P)H-hydrate epimerase
MARPETVITPHAGEFARIFGLPRPTTVNERIAQVRQVATGPGVVLLKGPQSITAGGGTHELWFNDTGHPGLATGGTGDFLAGMVAGFVGQRDRLPEGCRSLRHAVASAAWLHGRCADRIGQGPLLPRDLAEELPRVLRELYA